MIIYIFYEHLVREWEAINRLKSALEKKNNQVFVFSMLFERNKSYINSLKYKPDVIFMPWLTSAFFEKTAYFFVKRNPNVRIVDFHQEEISEPDSLVYFMPKTQYGKNAAFHISWGENFKNNLVANGVSEDRVFVTGNIRTDLLTKTLVTKTDLAQKYGLDLNKPWIMFADSRGYYNQRSSKSEFSALLKTGTTLEEILGRKNFEGDSIKSFVDDIKTVPRVFGNKYEFIYRPHPGTYAPEGLPDWVKIISERSISDWIPNVDLFISCGSTTIFEAEIAGVPGVMYDNLIRPDGRKFFGHDDYPIIRSLNEINDDLICELGKLKNNIYEKYIGKADGNSVNRVVEMTYKIIDKKYDSVVLDNSAKMSKYSFYDCLRHIIYETVIYFLVKTRLLFIFKWPNSAYVMRSDIPYNKENAWIKSKKT